MTDELGAWLRRQRQDHGWTRREMARRLRRAAAGSGDNAMPGNDAMCHNIRRWETGRGGISERHKLHYCTVLGITPAQFGPGPPPPPTEDDASAPATTPGTAVALGGSRTCQLVPAPADTGVPRSAALAYRGVRMPDLGDLTVEREVLVAAHESSEHAAAAEQRGVGEATLEQLRADVTRLSHAYMTGEPLPLFLEMRRVRNRIHHVLDRRQWPRDAAELYFLLGCINGLMAVAANALGYADASDELVRAGLAYATAIDHRPLIAHLRMVAADTAYVYNRPRQARDLAQSALDYLPYGPNAALMHLLHGLATARTGDVEGARGAITAAAEAREREYSDDLIQIGGEFNFSRASQHYYAGSIMVQIPGAESDAINELEDAIELYRVGPEPGEDHSDHCRLVAHIDLATGRLRARQLDGARSAIQPVLALPTGLRTERVSRRLAVVRAELARAPYQGSPGARDLDERIEYFISETVTAGLHSLSAGG